MYKLVYVSKGQEQQIKLNPGSTLIGRSGKCDLVIDEPSVSGQHVRLELADGKLSCVDQGSSNGISVNEKKVKTARLQAGDILTLGRLKIKIEPGSADVYRGAATQELAVGLDGATPPLLEAERGNNLELGAETPAAMIPAVVENRVPAVQVIAPEQAKRGAGRNKLLLPIVVAGVIALVVILAVPSRKAKKVKKMSYPRSAYWLDVESGQEFFTAGEYVKAENVWQKANDKWEKVHPEKLSDASVVRRLGRMGKKLAEGQKQQSFTGVDWIAISRETRQLLDDESMPDEVVFFVESLGKKALQESTMLKIFLQGKNLLAAGKYSTSEDILKQVVKNSHYYKAARNLINQAREADYDNKIEQINVMVKAPGCNWQDAVNSAEALLRVKDNPQLKIKVAAWRKYALQQQQVDFAEKAVNRQKADTGDLRKALRICAEIPRTSPFYRQAADISDQLKLRVFRITVRSLYESGEAAKLKALAAKDTKAGNDPLYLKIMSKLGSLLKHFDTATKALKEKDYFKARDHWDAIIQLEPRQDNYYNREAQGKLREWSLDKLGRNLLKDGEAAFASEDYARARKLFENARSRCGIEIATQIKAMLQRAKNLYNQAQVAKNSSRLFEATKQAKQAKACLLPGKDELYNKVDKFLNKLKSGGGI